MSKKFSRCINTLFFLFLLIFIDICGMKKVRDDVQEKKNKNKEKF